MSAWQKHVSIHAATNRPQPAGPAPRTDDAVDGRPQLVREAVHQPVLDQQQLAQALQNEGAVGLVEGLLGVGLGGVEWGWGGDDF